MEANAFDIIIAGGAMTGATLAFALAQRCPELSIAVVEASDVARQYRHPGFDARSIALSYGSVERLKGFDLWQDVASVATPISRVHISDQGHVGSTEIQHDQCGLETLGYVVELADMGRIFYARLADTRSITVFCPDRIERIDRERDQITVKLGSGTSLTGALLVAADGTHSTCCRLLQHEAEMTDFHQTAVISTVQLTQSHQGQAFERFTADGPVALLPMSQNRMSLVWCVRPETVASLLNLPDDVFLQRLQQAFGWRLGWLAQIGERVAYPLTLSVRKRQVSHRFAIVGNAAQTLHPIAGQGFNLGIRDVASLVDEIHHSHREIGDYSMLSRYQARRISDRQQTIWFTSSLVHLFSNSWLTTALGRNIGLMMLNSFPLLKRPLLQRVLGRVSR